MIGVGGALGGGGMPPGGAAAVRGEGSPGDLPEQCGTVQPSRGTAARGVQRGVERFEKWVISLMKSTILGPGTST